MCITFNIDWYNMWLLYTLHLLISVKCKHHNVLITNPLLIWSKAVIMEFITSTLVVQKIEAVILLIDDVFKVVILICNLIVEVYNAKRKGRYVTVQFQCYYIYIT